MLGKLPEIFGRNFAIGYFLPAAIFIATSLCILNQIGILNTTIYINNINEIDVLIWTSLFGLGSWGGGILLLAINRDIIRFMEGYGRFNPAHFFQGFERRRYRKLNEEILELNKIKSEQKDFTPELNKKRNQLMTKLVERFPDEEDWLLPTAFGNTIRAFEVYPRVMYGLDSIPGWTRLLAVIPADYRNLVDSAKTQLDFWVNVWILGFVILLECTGFAIYSCHVSIVLFLLAAIVVMMISYLRAVSAANGWGNLIKSSFDVFLPELYKKLGFHDPTDKEAEKMVWTKFSQAIIYRHTKSMPKKRQQ